MCIINIPFCVKDTVEDRVTHEVGEVIGIEYKHGLLGNCDKYWYDCVTINTTIGLKDVRELKRIEMDETVLIDKHCV